MKTQFRRFLQKYRTMALPLKAALWFTISNIIQRGISLITVPIFTRLLTTDQYGVYSVYNSWYSIISIIVTLNLAAGVFMKGLSKFDHDQDRFVSSMQGLYTLTTMSFFVIYLLFMDFFNELFQLSTIFMVAMFAELLFAPAFNFWSARQRFDFKYKSLIIVSLLLAITSPVLGVIAVLSTDYKAEARVLSFVLVQVCIGLFFYIKQFVREKRPYSRDYWKYALAFNIPLIPHYLSMVVLQQADRIMISRMTGDSNAAIYSIAYTVSQLFTIVTSAINSAYVPHAYQSFKKNQFNRVGKTSVELLALIAVASFFVTALGPEIIYIIAPPEYYDAIWIIPPVAASIYFMFFYNLFSVIEFYYEKTKFVMYVSVTGAVLNIILNYYCILHFGYIAAGYTTLVCYIFFGIAHYIFAARCLKQEAGVVDFVDLKKISGLSILLLISVGLMIFIYHYPLLRWGIIILLVLLAIIKRKLLIDIINKLKK